MFPLPRLLAIGLLCTCLALTSISAAQVAEEADGRAASASEPCVSCEREEPRQPTSQVVPAQASTTSPLAGPTASSDAHARARRLDQESHELRSRHEKLRLHGPIIVMSIGFATAWAMAAWSIARWMKVIELEDSTDADLRWVRQPLWGALGGVLVVGAGTAWLIARLRERSVIGRELRELRRQRQELDLNISPSFAERGAGLALGGRF